MKHIFASHIVLILALLNPVMVMAELPGVAVQVSNFSTTDGTVEVSLFNSAESFLVTPYLQQSGKIGENGSYSTYFASLPEGEYAVVVVHDANDNGQLDLGFLDFGGEDYGYSNQVRPWFGRPDFDEVKFVVGDTDVVIEIDFGND
jgi:uncharacterized protein (DUF2141 family)